MGAGMSGLALVHELRRRGITDVVVLEKTVRFEHIGAGIHVGSWGATLMDANGTGAAARARGYAYRSRRYLDRHGSTVGVVNHEDIARRHGGVVGFFLHRADLHEVLQAGIDPAIVHTGVQVESIDHGPDRVRLRTRDHGDHEVDLLVGCDGLHSQVRALAFHQGPHPLGQRVVRAVLPADGTLHDFEYYRGIGSSIGLSPLNPAQTYVWFNYPVAPGDDLAPNPRRGADLAGLMAGYTAPRIASLMDRMDEDHPLLVSDLYEVSVEPWWQGRVVLCGDAAHAMSPSTGSAGTMAMEDAFVLARALSQVESGRTSLDAALDDYYRQRLPRVEWVRTRTRMASYSNSLSTEELCRLRDVRDRELLADPDAQAFEVTEALDPHS
jgi:salicylate hydroxylase